MAKAKAMREPTFWILTALVKQARHGYGIIQDVAAATDGRYVYVVGGRALSADKNTKLVAVADQAFAEVPALAVSLEPAGGSPTGAPTGPVLYTGPFLKYW